MFAIGRRARSPEGAAHTYVAAAVWGTGTKARDVVRRTWPFTKSNHAAQGAVGDRLAEAVEILFDHAAGGAVAAYDKLHGGRQGIPHLGPSFGTKMLYFAGFDRGPHELQPLILDQYVAEALNRLCGRVWPTDGWTTKEYESYIHVVHRWAAEWKTRPDVVERVLFSVGKAGPLAVSALSGRGT